MLHANGSRAERASDSPARPSPRQLDAFYAVGHQLYELGDFARAADLFRYVVFVESRRAAAWWALGACHEQIDDLEAAAAVYACGFAQVPDEPELALLAARAFARSGERESARELCARARDHELTADQRQRLDAVVALVGGGGQ